MRPAQRTRPHPVPGGPLRGLGRRAPRGPRAPARQSRPHGGALSSVGATALTAAPSARTAPSASSAFTKQSPVNAHGWRGTAPRGRATHWANSRLLGLGLGEGAGADSRGRPAVSVRASPRDTVRSCPRRLASNPHRAPVVTRCHRPGLPLNPSPPPQTGGQRQSQPGKGAAAAGVNDGPRTPGQSSAGRTKSRRPTGPEREQALLSNTINKQ